MTTVVVRAPLRSRDDAVDHAAAVEHALRRGVVGVGGRLDRAPTDLDEAVEDVGRLHDPRVAARLRRFAALPTGSLAWTRDADAELWLGRLAGEWLFDSSTEASELDLQHVRACRWLDDPVPLPDVPAPVLATFARGGRNLQRIGDAGVGAASELCWDQHA